MTRTIAILSLLLASLSLPAQRASEIAALRGLNPAPVRQQQWAIAQNNESEFDLLFSGLFIFYKQFISSQDASRCSFTPSCSEYALEAIRTRGLVVGAVDFFDRFSRCNSLSPEDYTRHPVTGMLYDPVHRHDERLPYQDPDAPKKRK
ncbi:MAG: hypothetical protein OHK0039_04640 [Bacteroidia bacterium]